MEAATRQQGILARLVSLGLLPMAMAASAGPEGDTITLLCKGTMFIPDTTQFRSEVRGRYPDTTRKVWLDFSNESLKTASTYGWQAGALVQGADSYSAIIYYDSIELGTEPPPGQRIVIGEEVRIDRHTGGILSVYIYRPRGDKTESETLAYTGECRKSEPRF